MLRKYSLPLPIYFLGLVMFSVLGMLSSQLPSLSASGFQTHSRPYSALGSRGPQTPGIPPLHSSLFSSPLSTDGSQLGH